MDLNPYSDLCFALQGYVADCWLTYPEFVLNISLRYL